MNWWRNLTLLPPHFDIKSSKLSPVYGHIMQVQLVLQLSLCWSKIHPLWGVRLKNCIKVCDNFHFYTNKHVYSDTESTSLIKTLSLMFIFTDITSGHQNGYQKMGIKAESVRFLGKADTIEYVRHTAISKIQCLKCTHKRPYLPGLCFTCGAWLVTRSGKMKVGRCKFILLYKVYEQRNLLNISFKTWITPKITGSQTG